MINMDDYLDIFSDGSSLSQKIEALEDPNFVKAHDLSEEAVEDLSTALEKLLEATVGGLESLKDDLNGYSKEMQLAALSDGHFLADYDVDEEQVNLLYTEISKKEEIFFLDSAISKRLEQKADLFRSSSQKDIDLYVSFLAFDLNENFASKELDADIFDYVDKKVQEFLKQE